MVRPGRWTLITQCRVPEHTSFREEIQNVEITAPIQARIHNNCFTSKANRTRQSASQKLLTLVEINDRVRTRIDGAPV